MKIRITKLALLGITSILLFRATGVYANDSPPAETPHGIHSANVASQQPEASKGSAQEQKYSALFVSFDLPPENDPITAEKAAAISRRLINEQHDPVYLAALRLFAQERYAEAVAKCRNGDPENSMLACLMGRSMEFMEFQKDFSKQGLQDAVDAYLKACKMDNPYAMAIIDRFIIRSADDPYDGGIWRKRAFDYWLHRSAEGDPEALFCLGKLPKMPDSMFFLGKEREPSAFIIRSALQGHVAALLSLMEPKVNQLEFIEWKGVEPEIPGWDEIALEKLKMLADTGQPAAQYYYGRYTNTTAYLEKAAENGVHVAIAYLAACHFYAGGSRENSLSRLYYSLLGDLLAGEPYSYFKYKDYCWYRSEADGSAHYLTEREYQEQVDKAKAWHTVHTHRYIYVHPLIAIDLDAKAAFCFGSPPPWTHPEESKLTTESAHTLTLQGVKPQGLYFEIVMEFIPSSGAIPQITRVYRVTNISDHYEIAIPLQLFHPDIEWRLLNMQIKASVKHTSETIDFDLDSSFNVFELSFLREKDFEQAPYLKKKGYFPDFPTELDLMCVEHTFFTGSGNASALHCDYKGKERGIQSSVVPLSLADRDATMTLNFILTGQENLDKTSR